MNKPQMICDSASFKALGINPDKVEAWEDGVRLGNITTPGAFKWWYMGAFR